MSDRPRPRRLRTAAVRWAVTAPDLERYLSRRQVDLAIVDQVEALRVRVRRGVEVFEKRIEDGVGKARTRMVFHASIAILFGLPIALTGIGAILGGLLLFLEATLCAWAARDLAQLKRLRGSYWTPLEEARTIDDLLRFADSVLEDARALGVLLEGEME